MKCEFRTELAYAQHMPNISSLVRSKNESGRHPNLHLSTPPTMILCIKKIFFASEYESDRLLDRTSSIYRGLASACGLGRISSRTQNEQELLADPFCIIEAWTQLPPPLRRSAKQLSALPVVEVISLGRTCACTICCGSSQAKCGHGAESCELDRARIEGVGRAARL